MKVLVTGATGYVGGRLVPRLLDRDHEVRVLVRDPRRVADRPWADRVEIVRGDLLDPGSLRGCGRGIDAGVYLVHSMTAGKDFAERDRRAAEAFADAAAGLGRVVYLGGLLPEGSVSDHLGSRAEVGAVLGECLPTLELRAGPIIGPGSASFEMVRYLTERLPVMIAPRWIDNPVQPISVDDVLAYLVRAVESDVTGILEIGGADRPTFRQMMMTYAGVRGLWRRIFAVPVLAPALAARWVGLVTPISNRLAVPLVKGIVRPVVADTTRARDVFPDLEPVDYRTSVERAVEAVRRGDVRTRWTGALGSGPAFELEDREGLIREERRLVVEAPPDAVFRAYASLGGERGWLVYDWAWRVRGLVDQILGGPGLRRGRRDRLDVATGEAIDFWRVEEVDPPRILRLRAEMRLPGRAWLQWESEPEGDGDRTTLVQTALFAPRGLSGALYWNALYPFHGRIFGSLALAIAREAEADAR